MTEYLRLKSELDALNLKMQLLGGGFVDEMYLSKVEFCLAKTKDAHQKTEAKEAEIQTLRKSIEAGLNPPKDANPETAERIKNAINVLENKKAQNENTKSELVTNIDNFKIDTKNNKNGKIVILIAGLICLAAAIGLIIAKYYVPFGITAIVGAVLISLFNVFTVSGKKSVQKATETAEIIKAQIEGLENENKNIDSEIFDKKVKLEAINAALNSSAAVIENQRQMLLVAEDELKELKTAEETQNKILIELYSRYKPVESIEEIEISVNKLSEKSAKQKEIKQQLNFISKDLNGISYEDAKRKLDETDSVPIDNSVDFTAIKERYEQLISDMSERKSQIAALKAEIKADISRAENPEKLKKQLKETAEKALSQKEFCDAADIALSCLSESFAEVRRSYGSVLEKTAGEIFSGVTGGKYADMSISKSFDINVGENDVFGSREIDYLSSGTADQAYLSLRLALSKLMCQDGESLPILLDDALAQYDDGRMAKAIEFLKEYSENNQIVMFTCHKGISDNAEKIGAESISI